jgi:hypothetical protein
MRVALLDSIMAWAAPTSATPAHAAADMRRVFLPNGMAGTGKSTVARTIARCCADRCSIGSCFFFTRGGGDGDVYGQCQYVYGQTLNVYRQMVWVLFVHILGFNLYKL